MSIKNIKSIAVTLLVFLSYSVSAQEEVKVPLTNPNKEGFLKAEIINGSITVKGYEGDEVIVKGIQREGERRSRNRGRGNRVGLKRISANSLEFSVEEFDNVVRVKSSVNGTTDFEIKVPKNFSLKLSTVNRGDIYVENVNGTMDISNTNGKITLKDISGSVSADALNKDIIVSFVKVNPDIPMAFSSLNGDIDITLPKNVKADIKVKSDRGEIYTDFDIKTRPSKAKVIKGDRKKRNAYSVKVEKWIIGSINGGGPEILFKNFNGDVILRSR
ncbi:DUF4097 family beta strand repeat-containing protein [Tenacibaculum agarivorans]|uniref:DUF4097 family beta strand repeat-containing protein n=1 Tax=Tenacibaculum agarivorans TaxID=1908389 RepID=UPI000B2D4B56|nr:DUF4097 family beta strand repeat-containing protein [Tenacibaculum agarivorans]